MRPHGNAKISARQPSALGVCARCGFLYNNDDLEWQWDWQQGPRLFNLRIQVCEDCHDMPQESGRTIVLPPDPVPIKYPNPEDYVAADNPLSPLGYNVAASFLPAPPQSLGGNIGTLTLNAGVNAAFDGNSNKRAQNSAALAVSNSSFGNTVGKNWNADPSGTSLTLPSTAGAVTHVLASYALYAPSDAKFLNSATGITGFTIDGSSNNSNWTTLSSGATLGTRAEVITGTAASLTYYQYHRLALQGDGISAVAVAQAIFNVADAAANDI